MVWMQQVFLLMMDKLCSGEILINSVLPCQPYRTWALSGRWNAEQASSTKDFYNWCMR